MALNFVGQRIEYTLAGVPAHFDHQTIKDCMNGHWIDYLRTQPADLEGQFQQLPFIEVDQVTELQAPHTNTNTNTNTNTSQPIASDPQSHTRQVRVTHKPYDEHCAQVDEEHFGPYDETMTPNTHTQDDMEVYEQVPLVGTISQFINVAYDDEDPLYANLRGTECMIVP